MDGGGVEPKDEGMAEAGLGQVSFLEIGSKDVAATRAFFGKVFGWPCHDDMWFQVPGTKAGLHGNDPAPQVYVFFRVADMEAARARVVAAGGEAGPAKDEPGFGRFSQCRDPGGIVFGLHYDPPLGVGPLAGSRAMAVIGVEDLQRARVFYEGTLGLAIVSADDFALVADLGGVKVRISRAPKVEPAAYTVLGFVVPDTQQALRELAAVGVVFEKYAFLGEAQAADGLWLAPGGTRVAWFKDPDGNLLSLAD